METKQFYIRDSRSPTPANESVSKVMSSNKSKNTVPELLLRKALWSSGIRGYRIHWKKAPGTPDIAFPGRKLAVFVNGCYWHRCPLCNLPLPKSNVQFWKSKFKKNKERDKNKLEALQKKGWRTITIWECQVISNIDDCVKRIEKLLL